MTRPLFGNSLDELIEIFKSSIGDVPALRIILNELDHRNTAGARSLKATVSNRIVELLESRASRTSQQSEDTHGDDAIAPPDRLGHIVGIQTSESSQADLSTADPSTTTEVGDDLAGTLDEIRQRLLDLTRRNALLNYRHPKGRSIRVIDEMPDQLFDRLLGGDRFIFEPLPRVPSPNEEMSDSIREFLEAQNNWRRPSRNEWAQMHDIEPGYGLPEAGSQSRRHTDLVIQTLLFPDELETRLRTIASNAAQMPRIEGSLQVGSVGAIV